uniref:Major facilitator superfamily (MFS) profile domain-containing protein n=1 Tax=Acrobeloides nanus TaxID=290746 RepID=A0A914DWL7_9BILA
MVGFIIMLVSSLVFGLAKTFYILWFARALQGIGSAFASTAGMIDAAMFPHLGYIVDQRHASAYGSVYAIADAAACFGFSLGPFISGPLVSVLEFKK